MDFADKLKLLKKFKVLQFLPELALKQLAKSSRDLILKAKETLFEEGSNSRTMYFILKGELGVYKKDKFIVSRGPNEFLGEMSLIEFKPRSAKVEALTDSFLLEINEELFNSHLKSNPEVVMELLKTLSSRSREELEQISQESQKLKQQDELFSCISKALDDPNNEVFICDSHSFKIDHTNSKALKNLGYLTPELNSMTLLDLLPEILHENISRFIGGGNIDSEGAIGLFATFKRKDDSIYPVEMRFKKLHQQYSAYWVVLAKDISKSADFYVKTHKKPQLQFENQRGVKRSIKILSYPNLQNELFSNLIEKETGLKTMCMELSNELDSFMTSQEDTSFFLIDHLNLQEAELEFFNKKCFENLGTRIFAFFNVCLDHEISISQKVIQDGLRGAFLKGDSLPNVIKGIQAILNGEYWFPRNLMMRSLLERKQGNDISDDPPSIKAKIERALAAELTSREKEILISISEGYSNKKIAAKLNISLSTVKTHVQNIFPKIGVSGRLQAALWANKYL